MSSVWWDYTLPQNELLTLVEQLSNTWVCRGEDQLVFGAGRRTVGRAAGSAGKAPWKELDLSRA